MTEDELTNITASCAVGERGKKTFFKVLRGSKGKYGPQFLLDMGELKKAQEAGTYTFTDKRTGSTILVLNPKVWEKKPLSDQQWQQVQESVATDIDDSLPF